MVAGKIFIIYTNKKLHKGIFGIADQKSKVKNHGNPKCRSNMATEKIFISYLDEKLDEGII